MIPADPKDAQRRTLKDMHDPKCHFGRDAECDCLQGLAAEFVRCWTTDRTPDGCGMCGGIPHSATCYVGRMDALLASPVERQETGWQPIQTIPDSITRALFVWPAFKLDENCDLTDQRCGEIVATGYRSGRFAWEPSDEVNYCGHAFDDDFEYGDPILWQPLPSPPQESK